MFKPRIRILPDGYDLAPHWCGLFPGGYSSLGRVHRMPISEALNFYLRILRAEGGAVFKFENGWRVGISIDN